MIKLSLMALQLQELIESISGACCDSLLIHNNLFHHSVQQNAGFFGGGVFFMKHLSNVTHVQWMVLGTSGLPGASVRPRAAAVIGIGPAPARCLKTEGSHAAAHRDKPNFATSLSAQVRKATAALESLVKCTLRLEVYIKTSVS